MNRVLRRTLLVVGLGIVLAVLPVVVQWSMIVSQNDVSARFDPIGRMFMYSWANGATYHVDIPDAYSESAPYSGRFPAEIRLGWPVRWLVVESTWIVERPGAGTVKLREDICYPRLMLGRSVVGRTFAIAPVGFASVAGIWMFQAYALALVWRRLREAANSP